MAIKKCPKCNNEFDDYSKWGAKKFCSRKCSNSRTQTQEMRDKKALKISKPGNCAYCDKEYATTGALKYHQRHCEKNPNRKQGSFFDKQHTLETKIKQGQTNAMGLKVPDSILDMSKRTTSKVMRRLGVGCSRCGWLEGACDIHHILPRSKGGTDSNDNLTYICPNCHRLAHEGKITEFVSLTTQIGDEWRKYYFAHE